MDRHQKTLSKKLQISGIGLHSGKPVDVTLMPLEAGSGIWFQRTDIPGASPVLASSDNVSSTRLATTIGRPGESVSTLEHLLAALWGLGVSNLKVEVRGPELPILDGSAQVWASVLRKAGVSTLQAPRAHYRVRKAHRVEDGDRIVEARPANGLTIDATIEFPGYIESQTRHFSFTRSAFVSEICPARTFCLERDVEAMQREGLALGGGLDNAVVIGENGKVLNPEGLRFPDECARHKILDFMGDMALAQAPIQGHFTIVRTGHTLNQRFLGELLRTPGLLELVQPTPGTGLSGFRLPVPSVPALALAPQP
ncbi:MAG: UDP-3-O-acyl-N-acetylglucosamine deacetylase [Deltaproteobacteria bacterium]|jgi:UDP-3-O-[3-hydroxymyristoyl] N-acetylglucosamine deacetylase|nr:UDP-3-O-acyl-N-acetylglucosamine deacetylase [Deltaproteobacteria bacterium]